MPDVEERHTMHQSRRSKHVTRACEACRKRKTRCSGERPVCAFCKVLKIDCAYDTAQDKRRPLSKAYVSGLENRLALLEKRIQARDPEASDLVQFDCPPGGPAQEIVDSPLDRRSESTDADHSQSPTECLQIDGATGDFREYGALSMFKHLSADDGAPTSPAISITNPLDISTSLGNTTLPSNFSLGQRIHRQALRAFFTFFNPWCFWVEEKRFMDDMGTTAESSDLHVQHSTFTAHYSPLLHYTILAIGVMYLSEKDYPDRDLISSALARKAVTTFEEEIELAKTSAVVGLLLLGSHHAGHGRQSLGYIYAGTGLRLTRILGLGIDASPWINKGLITRETKRDRDRVWHTAYIQDKLWSTYVGRAPAPNLSHLRMEIPTVDDKEDSTMLIGLDGLKPDNGQKSLVSSTFTWTCQLARIVELILNNIYWTRKNIWSEEGRIAGHELSIVLEKWLQGLPANLRLMPVELKEDNAPTALPHIIVMHMMYRFASILLHRPNYHCQNKSLWQPRIPQDATSTPAATEACDQAADDILALAKFFDRRYGLQYAPVSITQFLFTAGTIHLLSASKRGTGGCSSLPVKECISALHNIGCTWKCALQTANILHQLVSEHLPNTAPNRERASKEAIPANKASGSVSIQELLEQNPQLSQQLQSLGWHPPESKTVLDTPSASDGLHTSYPGHVYDNPRAAQIVQQQHPQTYNPINNPSWMAEAHYVADNYGVPMSQPAQQQSLFDMLRGNDWMVSDPWSDRMFNNDAYGGFVSGWEHSSAS